MNKRTIFIFKLIKYQIIILLITFSNICYSQSGSWIAAENLRQGDLVLLANGTIEPIKTLEVLQISVPVYNFTVDQVHNYYVSESGVLAHNIDCVEGERLLNKIDRIDTEGIAKSKRLDQANRAQYIRELARANKKTREEIRRKLQRKMSELSDLEAKFIESEGRTSDTFKAAKEIYQKERERLRRQIKILDSLPAPSN